MVAEHRVKEERRRGGGEEKMCRAKGWRDEKQKKKGRDIERRNREGKKGQNKAEVERGSTGEEEKTRD